MFFTKQDRQDEIAGNVDKYSDSYARDVTMAELKEVTLHSIAFFSNLPSIIFQAAIPDNYLAPDPRRDVGAIKP